MMGWFRNKSRLSKRLSKERIRATNSINSIKNYTNYVMGKCRAIGLPPSGKALTESKSTPIDGNLSYLLI